MGVDALNGGAAAAAPAAKPELLSGAWYRVAELRPRLRSHVRVSRHEYRGERWYVLADRLSRRSHRLNPAAWFLVGLLNGRRRVQEIWDAAVERFGEDAPTQDDAIRLLGQLHSADLLQCDVTPDVDELLRRSQRIAQRTRMRPLPVAARDQDPAVRPRPHARALAAVDAAAVRPARRAAVARRGRMAGRSPWCSTGTS